MSDQSTQTSSPEQVGRVVVLPLSKAIRMAWQNLRLRPARTALTVLSILAAVGFVLFVLASGHMEEAADREVRTEITEKDEADEAGMTSSRMWWVGGISLGACAVGIVNAMLMSITERYREIGTLKCLGALDAFVLKLFLLESVFQGLVGAAGGIVVGVAGALLALTLGFIDNVGAAYGAIPWPVILVDVGIAVGVGMILSVIGALYPAYIAARMEPVDAMRARF